MKTLHSLFFLLLSVAAHPAARDTSFTLLHKDWKVVSRISYPEKSNNACLLLLHGWNLPSGQWCEKSSICSLALAKGFTLIIPDFGKSTYHWQTYPETLEKYRQYPTRKWMNETYIVHLQKQFKLLIAGQNNFVAGLSTGGRGAALFALELPGVFRAAACLSADFDQSKLLNEPINTGYYGKYESFPERWKGKDNIYLRAKEFKTPVILIHGQLDKMCPAAQSNDFYKELKRLHPDNKSELIIDASGGHSYHLWSKYTSNLLRFFEQKIR